MPRLFSVRRLTTTVVMVVMVSWSLMAAPPSFVITFDDDPIGQAPRGFFFSWVRQSSSGVWEVRGNAHHHVLAHVADPAHQGRSVAVSLLPASRNLRVTTRVRFTDGVREGGLVWRYRDGHNGYVAGVSLARREAILFRVTAGNRVQLNRLDDLNLDKDAWHTLSVVNQNDEIRVHLDGIAILHARDIASETGGAGVWSAGAADTWFDDLSVEPLPGLPK